MWQVECIQHMDGWCVSMLSCRYVCAIILAKPNGQISRTLDVDLKHGLKKIRNVKMIAGEEKSQKWYFSQTNPWSHRPITCVQLDPGSNMGWVPLDHTTFFCV